MRTRWRAVDRVAPLVLLLGAAAVMIDVARLVARHTIEIVRAQHLMPRWDLATHLGHGWVDYHYLATGRIPQLFWDLWLQGYWPPGLSLYQVPFYLLLGGEMTSGLWSSLVAFVLVGVTGTALLWRQWKYAAVLPAALFLALLMSSPFLLAYASVTMTETLGALAQLVVLLAYVVYRQRPSARAARLFAVSLSGLFFTKYNYFVLLVGPLVLYEWLEWTAGWSLARHGRAVAGWARRLVWTPLGAFTAVYLMALLFIVTTGGFEFRFLGRRISVHTIGNSGHVVLYLLLARLWYLHRHGRIDWRRVMASDPRVRPLLLWFVAPVTIWLASPYPNHIRDFFNLVFNRPLGDATVAQGAATYMDALTTTYFYRPWVVVASVIVFCVAAFRYREQPPLMRWLILAVPLQFGAIALHQTRFSRFLLLTIVLLCLAASAEVGCWLAASRQARVAGYLLAPVALACGVVASRTVVTEERFRAIAFEHYTDSAGLRAALSSIRGDLGPGDRLAIVGQSNELSPALFRWELGPPSGVACFPFETVGAARLDLALATRVLLLTPLEAEIEPLDISSAYLANRQAVLDRANAGEFVLRREAPVPELHVALRLYERASLPARTVACR